MQRQHKVSGCVLAERYMSNGKQRCNIGRGWSESYFEKDRSCADVFLQAVGLLGHAGVAAKPVGEEHLESAQSGVFRLCGLEKGGIGGYLS